MTTPEINELKIWILTAVLTLLLALVGYFLKRLLDSFDSKTREITDRLDQHNEHIVSILGTMAYHKEKLDWLERKIDRAS